MSFWWCWGVAGVDDGCRWLWSVVMVVVWWWWVGIVDGGGG